MSDASRKKNSDTTNEIARFDLRAYIFLPAMLVAIVYSAHTLVFQLEDTVRLFGTLLLLDPIHFPKSEPCLLIGSVCQNGALLGTSL